MCRWGVWVRIKNLSHILTRLLLVRNDLRLLDQTFTNDNKECDKHHKIVVCNIKKNPDTGCHWFIGEYGWIQG